LAEGYSISLVFGIDKGYIDFVNLYLRGIKNMPTLITPDRPNIILPKTPTIITKRKTDSKVILAAKNILGVNLWSMQKTILDTVFNERYVTVRSCHAIGKSFLAGCAVLLFLILNPNSIVITTAPTWNQVKNILWREIRKLHARAKINELLPNGIGGKLNLTDYTLAPQWYALGISPRAEEAERIQGFHSETGNILVLCDESPGCNADIINAAEDSLMTSPYAHMLHIGNPTEASGHFYRTHKDPKYVPFQVPFKITPNAKAGKDIVPYLITHIWVKEMIEKWGPEHPFVLNKVYAEFSQSEGQNMIPLAFIERAMAETKPTVLTGPFTMGVDIAEGGEDRSAIAFRANNYIFKVITYHNRDTMKLVAWIERSMKWFRPNNPQGITVNIDTIGVGKGVYDRLREKGWRNVRSVRTSRRPFAPNLGKGEGMKEFYSLKEQIWWGFRRDLEKGKILLVDKDSVKAALVAPNYETPHGKIKIEEKKVTRKRIGSTVLLDEGDAVILTSAKAAPEMRIY
jgi:hypothetical protein